MTVCNEIRASFLNALKYGGSYDPCYKTPDQFNDETCERYKKAVNDNPVILAANLIDHRYTGKMDSEDTKSALDYFKEIDPNVVPHVMKLMSKLPPYKTGYFEPPYSLAEPTAWWRSSLQHGFDKRLVEVALSLVSGTSSSGGLVSRLLDILMAIESQGEWKRQESWPFCTGN